MVENLFSDWKDIVLFFIIISGISLSFIVNNKIHKIKNKRNIDNDLA